MFIFYILYFQVYVKAKRKRLGKAQPFQSAVGKFDAQIVTVDSDQMVPVFSLMCPGISLSTLSHDIRLLNILKFKDICNRISITIEYKDQEIQNDENDIVIFNKKLVKWAHEYLNNTRELIKKNSAYEYEKYPYSWLRMYMPDIEQPENKESIYGSPNLYHGINSNLIGETEILSSFLDVQKATDINWVNFRDNVDRKEDLSPYGQRCDKSVDERNYQCTPSISYEPDYIWTRYPPPKTGFDM